MPTMTYQIGPHYKVLDELLIKDAISSWRWLDATINASAIITVLSAIVALFGGTICVLAHWAFAGSIIAGHVCLLVRRLNFPR